MFGINKEFVLLLHYQSQCVINCKYSYLSLPQTDLEIIFVIFHKLLSTEKKKLNIC